MTTRVAVADAKARLSEILRAVEERGERVVVERRGRPVAVIEPYDERLEQSERHWADRLDGAAADIADFDVIMKDVVKSRRKAKPRPVQLED
jgi:prevent-host-death family protein